MGYNFRQNIKHIIFVIIPLIITGLLFIPFLPHEKDGITTVYSLFTAYNAVNRPFYYIMIYFTLGLSAMSAILVFISLFRKEDILYRFGQIILINAVAVFLLCFGFVFGVVGQI